MSVGQTRIVNLTHSVYSTNGNANPTQEYAVIWWEFNKPVNVTSRNVLNMPSV